MLAMKKLKLRQNKPKKKLPRVKKTKKRSNKQKSPQKRPPRKKLETKKRVLSRTHQQKPGNQLLRKRLAMTLRHRTTLNEQAERPGCFLVTYTVTSLTNLKVISSLSKLSIIRLTDVLYLLLCVLSTSDLTIYYTNIYFRLQFSLAHSCAC